MDGRPNLNNKAAFSNFSDVMWTGPDIKTLLTRYCEAASLINGYR